MKITNRDIKILCLGSATLFIMQTIYDCVFTIGEIQRGWEEGSK